ncbi:family 20 glycosylhydrolase [bacterium]|nr:family 20 glycosylhydrolase [bacterium]
MKKISIFLIILFSTVSLFAQTKIIFDADIDTDCDDAGALAVLHALADNGEVEILATIVSTRYPYSAPCVEAINRYYGRPDIPIGAPKTTWSDSGSRGSAYAKHISTEYETTLNSNDDAPDAVTVYRQILAAQESNSVVILSVGYLTNMRDLLASEPDGISPLSGVELVRQKVSRWVQTGASYPSGYNTAVCGNYTPDPTSAHIAFRDWPEAVVPMYISGEGYDIHTGSSLPSTPVSNPVRRIYELRVGLGKTRDSWDQIGTLFAVRPNDARWTFRTNGYYYIFENGTYEWRTTPDKNHTVLEYNTSLNAGLRLTLDQLMVQPPSLTGQGAIKKDILISTKSNNKSMVPMIIPQPEKIKVNNGFFSLNDKTTIAVSEKTKPGIRRALREIGECLSDELKESTGLPLPLKTNTVSKNQILLELLSDEKLGDEGYELTVTPDGIKISAYKPAGIFYGCQSLRQLLPVENYSKTLMSDIEWKVPCVTVFDMPRFKWRGLMLDSCRHFFDVGFVKEFIDLMAMHKLNTFHWHLTEDQGWRIEIKKYPKLTEVGAWRIENGKKYGGFYTQEQIREIVKYAADRFITVVPEIEMPGHSVAAIASYPELSCSGKPVEVGSIGGRKKNVYCAGKENTFVFLENVLKEVLELFPGKYIHIGGDECPKDNWKKCPKCQARIKNEKLKDEYELQSYFIKRIEKFINANGKNIIGWDEILEGGLAPNAAVMSWRGVNGGINAAKQNHNVVMSPTSHCYFDYEQTKRLPLEKVYQFEPVPNKLSKDKTGFILGGQANLWTERIPTPEYAEKMLFPRTCALAEKLWSPENCSDFEKFKKRLDVQLKRFDILKVNYFGKSDR